MEGGKRRAAIRAVFLFAPIMLWRDVAYWHIADVPNALRGFCFRG